MSREAHVRFWESAEVKFLRATRLLRERKLAVGTVIARVAALRFFFIRTLKRREFREDLPYPKDHRRLPTVLSL